MRLKFIAEILDPVRVQSRIEKRAFTKPPFVPYKIWENTEEVMRRYSTVDILANYLLSQIIAVFECKKPIDTENPLLCVLPTFSSLFRSVRAEPLEGRFVWKGVSPRDLTIYPYFVFITRLWECMEPIISCNEMKNILEQ